MGDLQGFLGPTTAHQRRAAAARRLRGGYRELADRADDMPKEVGRSPLRPSPRGGGGHAAGCSLAMPGAYVDAPGQLLAETGVPCEDWAVKLRERRSDLHRRVEAVLRSMTEETGGLEVAQPPGPTSTPRR